jgi:hypothetical protein
VLPYVGGCVSNALEARPIAGGTRTCFGECYPHTCLDEAYPYTCSSLPVCDKFTLLFKDWHELNLAQPGPAHCPSSQPIYQWSKVSPTLQVLAQHLGMDETHQMAAFKAATVLK